MLDNLPKYVSSTRYHCIRPNVIKVNHNLLRDEEREREKENDIIVTDERLLDGGAISSIIGP